MEQLNQGKVFFGGIPTAPDVQLLMAAMPSWNWHQGEVVPYALIEAACHLKRGTFRWQAVTGMWRRRLLREGNIDTEAVPNEGIKWLLEEERLRAGVRDSNRHAKGQGRAHHRIARTQAEKLSEPDKKRLEHTLRISEMSYAAARGYVQEIAMVFKPVKSLVPSRRRVSDDAAEVMRSASKEDEKT